MSPSDEIKAILIGLAKKHDIITYGELAKEVHSAYFEANSLALFHILGDISREEYREGRGMLTATVVLEEEGIPGDGFFDLAEELHIPFSDKEEFWIKELKKVYKSWDSKC